MISRRQIIGGQPTQADHLKAVPSSASSSANSNQSRADARQQARSGCVGALTKMSGQFKAPPMKSKFQQRPQANSRTSGNNDNLDDYSQMSSFSNAPYEEQQRPSQQQQQHQAGGPFKLSKQSPAFGRQQQQQQQQQQQHEAAAVNQSSNMNEVFRQPQQQQFDPYSADSDEEDVWCSEERLFEDHIEEIYQRWPHLDDDIWCKLIIMERNRRIGKAYARVPIVTIDGSHELSYSGYKLALNGFDNPDRDEETEECRKRIGKGIKIKMDNYGNILIKRMSKAGVYVKEWINPAPGISGGSSNSTNGSSGAGVGRSMPSRKELIKAASMVGSSHHMTSSSLMNCGLGTPSSSGGSSMDSPNDSAICDDVLAINGRLDLDKIYVMFDIKKFQANINQELCRPYPDRRKLEQQCFSIVGLTRDSDDILNLPCWLMVINIVAIEMLNERLPMRQHEPNFVRIFEQNNYQASSSDRHHNQQLSNKEEDPYSLPANVSSSDMRSSINDYGSSSAKNTSHTNYAGQLPGCYMDSTRMGPPVSRSYAGKSLHPGSSRNHPMDQANPSTMHQSRQRGRIRQNLDGPTSRPPGAPRYNNKDNSERYNNSSSIYSPGHMLAFHSSADHSVPPKLPPRDFVGKKSQRSKSSSSIGYDDLKFDRDESIYSTGLTVDKANNQDELLTPAKEAPNQRKAKRNRFLDSLRAPLELARSNRSASVLDVPVATQNSSGIDMADPGQNSSKKTSKSKSGGGFSRAKKLSSFLGVGSKSKSSASDDSNYVQLSNGSSSSTKQSTSTKLKQKKQIEVDSVVDSNEDIDDSHHQAITNSLSSPDASYNDLDIPTPDYETDENIYALDDGYAKNGAPSRTTGKSQPTSKHQNKTAANARTRHISTSNNNNINNNNNNNNNNELTPEVTNMKKPKDDLYYSGFRAHVPNRGSSTIARSDHQIPMMTGRPEDSVAPNNRYLMRTNRMLAAKMNPSRDLIYGSTLGLRQQQQQQPSMTGSRYRSASMQRYYSSGPSIASKSNQRLATNSNQIYDMESPYMMSGLGSIMSAGGGMPLNDLGQNPRYGVSTAASCIAGTGRRRSVSKQLPLARFNGHPGNYQDIGRSSSGIYGVNSGSSSSEYADFQPQVRKVNSSGYLNSVFKGHHQTPNKLQLNPNQSNQLDGPPLDDVNGISQSIAINGNLCDGSKTSRTTQVRNHASRALKPTTQAIGSGSQEAPDCRQQEANAQGLVNGPAYRSYDSSNDSDPSYTNSSDGLDIYDQIGASQMTRPAGSHSIPHHGKLGHEQFLDHNRLAQPVHIGEWEDLYDR